MLLQELDQEQTEAIRDHWLGHRCMAFPDDGLVPREQTVAGPGESQSVSAQAVAAADFAAALMAKDTEAVEARKNRKSPPTALAAFAAISFATRHPGLLNAQATRTYHPGARLASRKSG